MLFPTANCYWHRVSPLPPLSDDLFALSIEPIMLAFMRVYPPFGQYALGFQPKHEHAFLCVFPGGSLRRRCRKPPPRASRLLFFYEGGPLELSWKGFASYSRWPLLESTSTPRAVFLGHRGGPTARAEPRRGGHPIPSFLFSHHLLFLSLERVCVPPPKRSGKPHSLYKGTLPQTLTG